MFRKTERMMVVVQKPPEGERSHRWGWLRRKDRNAYICTEILGDGQEATVYKAKKEGDDSSPTYALKLFKTSIPVDQIQRYDPEEIMALSMKVKSRHIVEVFDCFKTESDQLCLVSEFCDDGDLYARLHSLDGRLPHLVRMQWLIQISFGLCALKEWNIVHRDIKPENIFLTKSLDVKLGDFGVARTINPGQADDCLLGTLVYMPFEARYKQIYDTNWDMWSLGCVAYDLGSPKKFIAELEAIEGDEHNRNWFWGQRDALPRDEPQTLERLQNMVDEVVKENLPCESEDDRKYIELVLFLLRVDPADRPSVFQFLGNKYVEEIRSRLIANPISNLGELELLLHCRSFQWKGRGCWINITTGNLLSHYASCCVISHSSWFECETGVSSLCHQDEEVMEQLINSRDSHGGVCNKPLYTGTARNGAFSALGLVHIIIPTVGDVTAELAQCISSCLSCAQEHGHRSVAFPAIGCGDADVNYAVVARAFFRGITDWIDAHAAEGKKPTLKDISLVVHDGDPKKLEILDAFSATYQELSAAFATPHAPS